MELKGIISMTEFYELTEEIAELIDAKLSTSIDDLSNINDLIEKQIKVAYHAQQIENIQVNGG
jgi:predicted nucleotidyltransferase